MNLHHRPLLGRKVPEKGVSAMGRECGGTYTQCRSLNKGSFPRFVDLDPDDARESSLLGSLRDHPWARAMSFRGSSALLVGSKRSGAASSGRVRWTQRVGCAVAAGCVLAACSHTPSPSVQASDSASPPSTSTVFPSGSPLPTTTPAASVLVVPAPAGPITVAQLGSPEAAASTWLSRWCAYDWHTPLGTRENRAHPAMSERGWLGFDPLTSPASAKAWAAIVATRQSAVCSAPTAVVSPEAPRSATGAYMIVTANRVVTPEGGAPVVEQVRETRQVLLREGRWLVDIAANGAG